MWVVTLEVHVCGSSPGIRPRRSAGAGAGAELRALPAGTVTFAFTDIEASTEWQRRLGDRYADLLAEHRRIVRTTFRSADGTEIDRQGDAFFYAFSRARDAVRATVEAQRAHALAPWPEGGPVRVRIGLHTGEPTVGAEGYLGIDVVTAARICKVARGGDVLLSETTRSLARSTLPEGVAAVFVEERHLKDLDAPVRLYRLAIDDVDAPAGLEQRLGTVGTRLVADIGERIGDSLGALAGAGGGAVARSAVRAAQGSRRET